MSLYCFNMEYVPRTPWEAAELIILVKYPIKPIWINSKGACLLSSSKILLRLISYLHNSNIMLCIFLLFTLFLVDRPQSFVKTSGKADISTNKMIPSKLHLEAQRFLWLPSINGQIAPFFQVNARCYIYFCIYLVHF